MKRWIFTILLFLLLGAIVNVAVAWGCAIRIRSDLIETNCAETWPIPVPTSWPDEPNRQWCAEASGVHHSLTDAHGPLPDEGDQNATLYRLEHFEVGWPIRNLTCMRSLVLPDPGGILDGRWDPTTSAWTNGLSTRLVWAFVHDDLRGVGSDRRLPIKPLWPGFLINTLFYAAILCFLICGPLVVRRLIRIRRGRCPQCGYDLRGELQGGCPECGWRREGTATQAKARAR